MTGPKPLTKESDAEIIALRQYVADSPRALRAIEMILGAEQFWLEAVKGVTDPNGYDEHCTFCGWNQFSKRDDAVGMTIHSDPSDRPHAPDCPWLLSQDPK